MSIDVVKKLEILLNHYEIKLQTYDKNKDKNKYFIMSDENMSNIPFEDMSEKYRVCRNTKSLYSNRIDLQEMIYTMQQKREIKATTKSNMYKLVEFYEAVERINIDKDFVIVDESKPNIFRYQDVITYRIIKNLNNIFPNIDTIITTQYRQRTVRGELIFDIFLNISPEHLLFIEIDENHHSKKNNDIADTHKRNIISRMVELRVFKKGRDDTELGFHNFLKSLCYDYLSFLDRDEHIEKRLIAQSNLIAYNIKINGKCEILASTVKRIVKLIKSEIINIEDLVSCLHHGTTKIKIKKISSAILNMIKNNYMSEKSITISSTGTGCVLSIDRIGFQIFLMMYQDISSNKYREMISIITNEYLSITNGAGSIYRYKCSLDEYNDSIDSELSVHGNIQIKYKSDKKRSELNAILKKDEDISLDPDIDEPNTDKIKKIIKKKQQCVTKNIDIAEIKKTKIIKKKQPKIIQEEYVISEEDVEEI
jgi:hypothetical protein